MPSIPNYLAKWFYWAAIVIIAVMILWAASTYLDAATALLPGGEGTGG